MEAVHLGKVLDPSIPIKTTIVGLPRTGNKEWANFVDATVKSRPGSTFQFMINGGDPVPKVPPVEIGYRHPSGEIFINPGGEVVRCPGQENENCSTGISVIKADFGAHKGPYAGVTVGSKFCTI